MAVRSSSSVLAVLCHLVCLALAVSSEVDLGCQKYVGVSNNEDGVSKWLGMRYAAPPLEDLRFMPPQDPDCNDTTQEATDHGKICLATGDPPSDMNGEDCLFLDVYAPSNATKDSKLPVFFFIQGGGFNTNSNPNLDGTGLIKASGHSIIVVTFNYRVGAYGFITNGDDITPNNGLRDQRKALEWVQKNIAQFGGNPGHVVLGGDSAGAASISLHLTAYGGRNTSLFHAVAAESVSFATVLTVAESQYQYDNLAINLGCAGTGSLACIKNKTAAELQAAGDAIAYPGAAAAPLFMWNPVIDGDLIRELTYAAFANGQFVRVPAIVGDDTNGGTTFAPRDAASVADSDAFLKTQFPALTLAQLGEINALYPNANQSACPAEGCWWRQTADAYGDMRYTCPGLYISSALARAGVARSYNYLYDVEDPAQVAEGLGVPHTVELGAVFGPDYLGDSGTAPASYSGDGVNVDVVPVIQAYWTSFIRTFDPNAHRREGSAAWDAWTPDAQHRLVFETGGGTRSEAVDATQKEQCEYFASIGVEVKQ